MNVQNALERLFPSGTLGAATIDLVPALPTDIFGAAAFLLEKSGAYHLMFPLENQSNRDVWRKELKAYRERGVEWATAGIELDKKTVDPLIRANANRKLRDIQAILQDKWKALVACGQQPIITDDGAPQDWWIHAACLFVFADEAARDAGYRCPRNKRSLIDVFMDTPKRGEERQTIPCTNSAMTHYYGRYEKNTYALYLDPNVARVMPKGRTPAVGATMRALSHNLCFISNPAALDLAWFVQDRLPNLRFESLNLLLVPFPFDIPARSFKASYLDEEAGEKKWGSFEVQQTWLHGGFDVVELIRPLLKNATRDQGPVHGIILPELALDWKSYKALVEFILGVWNPERGDEEAIQFIVCGVSQNHESAPGNFAYVTSFDRQDDDNGPWQATTFGRRKHHRWKLTSDQLTEYALSSGLDPAMDWWEDISIQRRGLAVHVFRESMAIAALICEDLARSDPCHEPIRSLGPNLIVALLMDGAQLPERWPGRYATGLADDPGSSVLTLSSLGLIERSNGTARHSRNRTVAMWKDDSGHTVQLQLPDNAKAIMLTLSASRAEEATLDGRMNSDAIALRYQCHQPILS